MALRYEYPKDAKLCVRSSDLETLPQSREPGFIRFGGVADIDDFLVDLNEQTICKVVGPTGVGKSSILPKLIALKTRKQVLVVTAHPMLAYCGHSFFMRNKRHGIDASALRAGYMVDKNFDLGAYDIVWVGASRLVSWLLDRQRDGTRSTCLDDKYVFLDEAHESDAYTHVVRSVTRECGAKCLLMVSATFEATGYDLGSIPNVDIKTFSSTLHPKTWDVESHEPWGYPNLKATALIFMDNVYDAKSLRDQYNTIGYEAHVLTSRTRVREFDRAMDRLQDAAAPPVVLIADSSYRSGFNFDVDVIIDSGVRYLPSEETGIATMTKRYAYEVEMVQAAGRGGRFGRKTVYYMPDIEPPSKICHLEGVESEAASYILRGLGYIPTGKQRASVMIYDDLPVGVDPVTAINGVIPLTSYVRDQFGRRKAGAIPVNVPVPPPSRVSTATSARRSKTTAVSNIASERHYEIKQVQSQVETISSNVSSGTRLTVESLRKLDTMNAQTTRHGVNAHITAPATMRAAPQRAPSERPDIPQVSRPPPMTTATTVADDTVAARSVLWSARLSARPVSTVARSIPLMRDKCESSVVPRDSISQLMLRRNPPSATARDSTVVKFEQPKSILRSVTRVPRDNLSATGQQTVGDLWDKLVQAATIVEPEPVKCGCYLYCPNVDADHLPTSSKYFPASERSVLRLMQNDKLVKMAASMSDEDLRFALYHALKHYNTLNMEVNAVKRAMVSCCSDDKDALNNSHARKWFDNVVGFVADWELERDMIYDAILCVSASKFEIRAIDDSEGVEDELAESYRKYFARQMRSPDMAGRPDFRQWVSSADRRNLLTGDRPSGSRDKDKVARALIPRDKRHRDFKTVYIKPMVGISSVTVHPDKTVEVKPGLILRTLTGIDLISVKDPEYVRTHTVRVARRHAIL